MTHEDNQLMRIIRQVHSDRARVCEVIGYNQVEMNKITCRALNNSRTCLLNGVDPNGLPLKAAISLGYVELVRLFMSHGGNLTHDMIDMINVRAHIIDSIKTYKKCPIVKKEDGICFVMESGDGMVIPAPYFNTFGFTGMLEMTYYVTNPWRKMFTRP
jgi:hypothetical protein